MLNNWPSLYCIELFELQLPNKRERVIETKEHVLVHELSLHAIVDEIYGGTLGALDWLAFVLSEHRTLL